MSTGPIVLTAHALDTGSGDGIVSDAAVFSDLECRAACVVTSVVPTEPLPLELVARQLEQALLLGHPNAVRVGFVRGSAHVELIAHFVRRHAPEASVFAPALRAGTETLCDTDTQAAMERALYPAVRVVVARASDLGPLSGHDVEDVGGLRDAALRIRERGARAVVVSGWIARGRVVDLLDDGGSVVLLDTTRIHTPHVRGLTGSYAASLAAHIARGLALRDAAEAAQRYVGFRIQRGR